MAGDNHDAADQNAPLHQAIETDLGGALDDHSRGQAEGDVGDPGEEGKVAARLSGI